jgi:peptide/nickel transport system permease protein
LITYTLRRVLLLVPVLWVVATLVWVALFILPGDPVRLLGGQTTDPVVLERIRADWGLDDPPLQQYGRFLWRLAHFDLGESYVQRRPVAEILLDHVPATLILAVTAVLLALGLGLAAGIVAALWRGSVIDTAVLATSLIGLSTPVFWLGLMLMLLLASSRGLGWLPVSGYGEGLALSFRIGTVPVRLPSWSHLVLPALTLALVSAGSLARMTRSSILDVLRQDYVRAAQARGLSSWRVLRRHVLRNALIPVVTLAGLDLAALVGGAIATEFVFAWPGLGKAILRAINLRDLPVVEGGVLLMTSAFVAVTLLVDLSYGWIDPRTRGR